MLAGRSGGTGWTKRGCGEGPPRIDKTTRCCPVHRSAKADDVQFDSLNDAYADHVVQVMTVSLRKLNRLLGQLVEGQASLPSNRLTATNDRLLAPPALVTRTCVETFIRWSMTCQPREPEVRHGLGSRPQ